MNFLVKFLGKVSHFVPKSRRGFVARPQSITPVGKASAGFHEKQRIRFDVAIAHPEFSSQQIDGMVDQIYLERRRKQRLESERTDWRNDITDL